MAFTTARTEGPALVQETRTNVMMIAIMKVVDSLREGGKEILAKAERIVREHALEPTTVLVESLGGRAADFIVEQPKESNAELIVMGTHGRRGLRRLALGSDAELVVRSSPVPVLLVRGPAAAS